MEKRLSTWSLIGVLVFIFLFSVLLITDPELYDRLSREDRLIEYLTALFLAVTGFLFLRSSAFSLKEKPFQYRNLRTALFVFAGVVFILAAGEEISWGQRIFNFETPEELVQLNDQDEFNFHNIDKKFFDRAVDRATIAFVFFGAVLVFLGEKWFLGIRSPGLALVAAFALTPFYHQYNQFVPDFYHLQYVPLIVLLVYSIVKRNSTSIALLSVTIVISLLLPFFHMEHNSLFPAHNNSANEYKEFLFSLCCLFYAFVIMVSAKQRLLHHN
jgi:hypothetical protein